VGVAICPLGTAAEKNATINGGPAPKDRISGLKVIPK